MSWIDSFLAQRRFIATTAGTAENLSLRPAPRVQRCDNCGAPLGVRCICKHVRNLGPHVIGRLVDPTCAAATHNPGRLTCRFCGVENT